MLLTLGAKILGFFGLGDRIAQRFAIVPLIIMAVLAFLAVKWSVAAWMDRTIETAKDAGATGVVVQGQNQTLEQLGDANNAEANLRAGGERSAIAYDECLRNNTRKSACERYNPDARDEQLVPGR